MKQSILLLLLFGFLSAKSQTNSYENYEQLKINSPIKSSLDRKINYINIGYLDNEASYLKIYLNDSIEFYGWKENSQHFDLNFEGDVYMLNQNYPLIDLPSLMHITNQNGYGKAKNDVFYIKEISIYRDSTIFIYLKNKVLDKGRTLGGFPAKYLGNLKEIEEEIALNLAKNKSIPLKDSVCVFELVVTKQGALESGKLIGGEKSTFTELVYETVFLEKNRNFEDGKSKWKSAITYSSGRPINTKLKLYARVNNDGSVSVGLPSTLRNFTGN